MFKFLLMFVNIFIITTIILFSMVILSNYHKISYSQVVVLSTSHHIQNTSVITLPSLGNEIRKTLTSKPDTHIALPFISKSMQINNTISYTIVNATITIMEKFVDGITKDDSALANQSIVTPMKKILRGKV